MTVEHSSRKPSAARPARLASRRAALAGRAVFFLLAAAGTFVILVGNWGMPGAAWGSAFSGGGDFPAAHVVAALAHPEAIAAAYRGDVMNPYPLPYELLFAPLAPLSGVPLRLVVTLASLGLAAAAVALFARRRSDAVPALLSPPLAQLLADPHLMAAIGLAALGLAFWAYRRERWVVLGAALALALIRPPNALPAVALVLVALRRRPRALARTVVGGGALLAVLTALATVLDPGWPSDFLANSEGTMIAGLPLLVAQLAGLPGALFLVAAVCALAAGLGLRAPAERSTWGAAAAVGLLASKVSGLYSGIYAAPGLAALSSVRGYSAAAWLASAAAWLAVLAAAPAVFASGHLPDLLSGLAYLLVLACYPLLTRARTAGQEGDAAGEARTAEPVRATT